MDWIVPLAAILGSLMLGAMSPGPSFLHVARLSVARGWRDGVACAVGMGLGAMAFGLLALVGLHGLLLHVPMLYLALKVLGGAYLLILAWRLFRGATDPLTMDPVPIDRNRTLPGALAGGLAIQLANPKTALVFGGIFAAMMPAAPPTWVYLTLPPLILFQETLWYALVALLFSSPKPRALHARGKHWFDRMAGTVLGALGIRLIWDALQAR
ncbi:MAG: LysE family transporter [Rhodospirillum sp.]|nr:LysE family transporter [Rhodospirillum sp.]MCF8488925.1 LysE family transporter [Rhodospirillum sp.]MCF8498981.1 LysE family transporter [Rhodospirillum sp.]